MKYRVRDDEKKGDFEVQNVRQIDAKTRGFIAKAVVVTGLILLVGTAAYAAMAGKSAELTAATSSMTTLMGFVLGHYFKNRDE